MKSIGERSNQGAVRVWFVLAIYAGLMLAVLYPISSVEIPALGDYLKHLARMHVLAEIDGSSVLGSFYEVHWAPIPYLGMDAVLLPFLHIMPIYLAGRIFIGLCLVLPVVSVAALHYVVHRRVGLVPTAAFLFSYNLILSWGFLPYLLSISLCILLFAGWLWLRETNRWLRAAVFAFGTLVLYFCHLFGLVAYCIAVGGFELGRAWRRGFRPVGSLAADWTAALLQIAPVCIIAARTHLEPLPAGSTLTSYGNLSAKITALSSPVGFLGGRIDLVAAYLVLGMFVVGLLSRRLVLSNQVWPSLLALAAVAVATPEWLNGVWGADFRLPLVICLMAVAGTSLRLSGMSKVLVLALVAALSLLKAASAAVDLRGADRVIAEVRRIVAVLPEGSRVLVVQSHGPGASRLGPDRMYNYVSMVAVIDRNAFEPEMGSGLTIVGVRPDLAALRSSANGRSATPEELRAGLDTATTEATERNSNPRQQSYWRGWQTKFQYVIWQHYGARPADIPALLQPQVRSGLVDIYRVLAE